MIQALKQFIKSLDVESDMNPVQSVPQLITQLNYVQGDKPKIFANSIGGLIQIVENHALETDNKSKFELVDIIICSIETYPSTIRKNNGRAQKLFDLICRIMANVSLEVPQIWFNPTEQYNEDDLEKFEELDSDAALVCKLRSCFDRLSSIVGYMKMVKAIQNKAINLYQGGDWRWKNAVLMCVSQLTEDVMLDQMGNIMSLVKMGLVDSHPKVRFAAIQALGQLSDDLKPQFQNLYFNELMPVIINGLDDQVERVAAHWMACLTNFVQDFTETTNILPFVDKLVNKICYFIEFGQNAAKQNSIATLSSLVTIPSLFDKDSIRKPFQICHSIFQTFTIEKHKQLINQTVECITITVSSQPYGIVKDYMSFVVEIIKEVSHKISSQYLITGWHRICTIGQKFPNWMQIFPTIFEAIKSTEISELKGGLDAILCTVDCFRQDFYPYSSEVLTYLQHSYHQALEQADQQITIASINAIQQILTKAKPSNPDVNWDNIIKQTFISYSGNLTNTIDNNYFQTCQKMLDSIKELLVNYSHLFIGQDLIAECENYWKIVGKLQVKKYNLINNQQYLSDDEEVDQQILQQKKKDDLKGVNTCKLCVPDIIQAIMKLSQNKTPFIPLILNHASQSIVNTLDEQDLRYATYYIDNLLQDCDYEMLKQYWGQIYNHLSQFSVKADATLRNSSIFGIGVLAQKTPFELVTKDVITSWVQVAKTAYSMPKNDKQSKKVYGHCQDNCVAAIGKVLKRYHKNYDLKPLYEQWLMSLPLKFDADENALQINHLCDLLLNEPEVLIDAGNQGANSMKQIFKTFAGLVCHLRKKKLKPQGIQILKRSKEVLLAVRTWPVFKLNQGLILSLLSSNQQFQLKELLCNESILQSL